MACVHTILRRRSVTSQAIKKSTIALSVLRLLVITGLLAGPLQPCRIAGKIQRWSAQIAPFISADQGNSPPRYPPKRNGRAVDWQNEIASLQQEVTSHVARFADSVVSTQARYAFGRLTGLL